MALVAGHWDLTPPAKARSELVMASFTITTAAAVANREVRVTLMRGTDSHLMGSSCFAQVASTTYRYVVGQHGALNSLTPFGTIYIPIPSLPMIMPADRIRFIIIGHQATDEWFFRATSLKYWNVE